MEFDYKKTRPVAGLLFLLAALHGSFATAHTVTASFSADPGNPHNNQFVITTPATGYCEWIPHFCKNNNVHNLPLGFEIQNSRPIQANHPDARDGVMFEVDSKWRTVRLNGVREHDLRFRIVGFNSVLRHPDVQQTTGFPPPVGHQRLWEGGDWNNPGPPCTFAYNGGSSYTHFGFVSWLSPLSKATCGKAPNYTLPTSSVTMTDVNFLYELDMPDPFTMAEGLYTGQLFYIVTPAGDISFGNNFLHQSPHTIRVGFEVTVKHMFRVDLPPGADRLALRPEGGWMQWLQRGRRPEKLSIDQHFQLWAASPFTMSLECQYLAGAHCAIQNGSGHQVPVQTSVTLPHGVTDASGQPVNRQVVGHAIKNTYRPSYFLPGTKSMLHFEVSRDHVGEMTDQHAGSHYAGNVTVVWDSGI